VRLVLFGPPGSGKGTQAGRICARFGLTHLSTGNILREEIGRCTPLGLKVEGIVKSGALVDDSTVNAVVFGRLGEVDGFLLDGYPRNTSQAVSLDGFLGSGRPLTCAVMLRVEDSEVVDRLAGRASCGSCGFTGRAGSGSACPSCGGALSRRPDDDPGVICRRLEEYRRSTAPLEAYYGSRMCAVDGTGTVDEVWSRIEEVLTGWE
jgi:adenylate kinase